MAIILRVNGEQLTGNLVLRSNNASVRVQDQSTISIDVIDNIGTSIGGGYLSSINQVQPNSSGNIQILGDYCTSLNEGDQGLQLFDGCKACNDCHSYWKVRDQLLTSMYWIIGLKDMQLYQQPAASRLWNQMIRQLQTDYLIQPDSVCSAQGSKLLQLDYRSRQIGTATKMLYQYKALVAMWNYLVHMSQGVMQVLQATQSYSGFVVQTKRYMDLCTMPENARQVVLRFSIQQQKQQTLDSALQGNAYVGVVNNNTHVTVEGTQYPNTVSSPYSFKSSFQGSGAQLLQKIQAAYTYNIGQGALCKIQISGAVKILPVICKRGEHDNKILTISEYTKSVNQATQISEQQQTQTVRWKIQTWWQYTVQGNTYNKQNTLQTMYYTTGYNLSPKVT